MVSYKPSQSCICSFKDADSFLLIKVLINRSRKVLINGLLIKGQGIGSFGGGFFKYMEPHRAYIHAQQSLVWRKPGMANKQQTMRHGWVALRKIRDLHSQGE